MDAKYIMLKMMEKKKIMLKVSLIDEQLGLPGHINDEKYSGLLQNYWRGLEQSARIYSVKFREMEEHPV